MSYCSMATHHWTMRLLVRPSGAENAMLPQTLYSSDLAPCDLFLFPKIKKIITSQDESKF